MTTKRRYRPQLYHSRVCRTCDRVYLFPFYGGRVECHDCRWEAEDASLAN